MVNESLLPALVAASGGSAMIAAIAAREWRSQETMRRSRERLSLRFPLALDPKAATVSLGGLSGLTEQVELVFEVTASTEGIAHHLLVPEAVRGSVVATLSGAMPGLRADDAEVPEGRASYALRVFVPTPTVLHSDNAEGAARTLLAGLAALLPGEMVSFKWALRPDRPRPLRTPESEDRRARETHAAWRQKTASPGFQVAGLVMVKAASSVRARALAEHVAGSLRSRRGGIGGLRLTSERSGRGLGSLPKTTRSSGWLNLSEVLPLLGLPLGDAIPGVSYGTRELLVPRQAERKGRVLFVGRDSSGERPVALSPEAARHHMAVIGPSGVGKSVLLTNAILSDIESGFGGVVIDPKADLIDGVLDRVKPEHADRIAVLDPGDTTRPIPGLSVLSGGDANDRADVLTGTLKAIFAGAWGVRSEFYGRLAILTLGEIPGASLADMGRLFYEEPYRRAAVARLNDPFTIAAWQSYEALSDSAKAEHVQAPMARVMTLLSRPKVRAVLASHDPKLDVARLLRERKWLLVSLAPGALSEAGATLVGAAVMYTVWSAIEARVTLPPEKRHPLYLYVDELATLTNGLPFGVELLAERARGLGAGLTVALQTLGRIGEPTRSALVGNLATMITFRAGAKEAPGLASELPGVSAADLQNLGRFEVAARVGTGAGSSVSVVTGRTLPPPAATGQAAAIRDTSARAYGSSEEPVAPAAEPPAEAADDSHPGRTRRTS
jgi:hypothetical protein